MRTTNDSATGRLLSRYGIASPETHGSDSLEAANGGFLAIVDIVRLADSSGLMRVQIGSHGVATHCPVTEDRATEVVREFGERHMVPHDASFASMLAHLLMKISKLYTESGARTLSIRRLHLHAASYHIDGITMEPKSALYAKPRRSPNAGRSPVEVVPKRRRHRR